MAQPAARTAPVLGQRVIEALLTEKASGTPGSGLVLVHGRYDSADPAEFTVRVGERRRRVAVTEQHAVLGITAAWHDHRRAAPDGDGLLVVVTEASEAVLGWDLRGHALGNRILHVDRAEIVRQRFGADQVDPRVRAEPWLVTALLDAEPRDGWPRAGGLLTRDAALRALTAVRLGLGDDTGAADAVPDTDALLAWSRTPSGPARFAALPQEEQAEITAWLADVAGPAVRPLLALAAAGRGQDAMPLGVVGSVIGRNTGQVPAEVGIALGALFGRGPDLADLRAFTAAVEGALSRWLAATGDAGRQPEFRGHALEVLRRADALAAGEGLTRVLADNPYLPSGLEARIGTLADALRRSPEDAGQALARVREHRLAPVRADRVRVAEAAVRLARFLARPAAPPVSTADGLARHLADWGWADRALTVLWAGDPDADAVVGTAYHEVCGRVRQRRAELDAAFARRLAGWTRTADTRAPGGCLLVEDVLAEVVAPLRGRGEPAPLVLLLDGMSSAVAVELAEELGARGDWTEAGRRAGARDAAAAVIPSLTRLSRTSLLTGRCATGGQSVEKDGFAAFWKPRRDPGAVLFHKAEIPGRAGRRLSDRLQAELAGESVVGVVLNTVDESLDHAPQGDRTGWRLRDITYLEELLAAARSYGRPVVLTSDHGHVLERGDAATPPAPVADGEAGAARWRTGVPARGEVLLSGPRVLEGVPAGGGDREVVVPWSEDVRYTPRKGGYHGGASLAEMTVPVLVFLPDEDRLPKGWARLAPEEVTPAWWTASRAAEPVAADPDPAGQAGPVEAPGPDRPVPAEAVRPVGEATRAPTGLGHRIVESGVYQEQKKYVPRKPKDSAVAEAIDAFVAAGGTLSTTALAVAAGYRHSRTAGATATLQRLLNVEGYPVLELVDGGTRLRLNTRLARQQFQVDDPPHR